METNELVLEEAVEFVLLITIINNGAHQYLQWALFMIPVPCLRRRWWKEYNLLSKYAKRTRWYLHMKWVSLEKRNLELRGPKSFIIGSKPSWILFQRATLSSKSIYYTNVLEKMNPEQRVVSASLIRHVTLQETPEELSSTLLEVAQLVNVRATVRT